MIESRVDEHDARASARLVPKIHFHCVETRDPIMSALSDFVHETLRDSASSLHAAERSRQTWRLSLTLVNILTPQHRFASGYTCWRSRVTFSAAHKKTGSAFLLSPFHQNSKEFLKSVHRVAEVCRSDSDFARGEQEVRNLCCLHAVGIIGKLKHIEHGLEIGFDGRLDCSVARIEAAFPH